MSGPLNSSRPTTAQIAGGVYNASTPAPVDQQAMALQVDDEGNLLVNIAAGGGGGNVTSKIEDSDGNPLLSNGAGALQVDVVDSVEISNFPATQPVSGTVAVSNFPATQPISAVSLPLPANAAQETGGNLATIATAQGVSGTGITFPAGGSGILGWLSGIYNRLAGVVLAAGSAIIGKVGIDQTTPGTTNGVQINAALPAGTNAIGSVELLDSGGTNKASISAAGAVKVDGSAVTQPISGTVTATVASTTITGTVTTVGDAANGSPVAGNPVLVGGSDGTDARTIATDSGGQVKVLVENGSAIPVSLPTGQAVELLDSDGTNKASISAAGAIKVDGSAVTQPVSIATMPALVAGSAIIGKVGIDQTTPGTTNGVQVNAALPAGTNLLGKVGIDQTTPGTTNAVQDASDGSVSAGTAAGKSALTGSQYNSTPPTLTSAQQVATQSDTTGGIYINAEGRKQTYVAQFNGGTIISGNNFYLGGSSTKTIRITRIMLSGHGTSASNVIVGFQIVSSAPTGGTSSTSGATSGPMDSSNAAGTATIKYYTVAPSGGGTTQTFFAVFDVAWPAPGNPITNIVLDYTNRAAQAPVIRGIAQGIFLFFGSIPTGGVYTYSIEWTEE